MDRDAWEAWECPPLCIPCPKWPMEKLSHLARRAVCGDPKAEWGREKPNYLGLLAVPAVCQEQSGPLQDASQAKLPVTQPEPAELLS